MEFRRVLFRSGGIAAGQAVANGSSRGAACAGLPGFAWPEWRIDVPPGLFAGCGATSDGHAHRRMAACRSSGVSLGIPRSEEHTSELQSLMRMSYAVFCLEKQKNALHTHIRTK